jgi:mRNA-degrading endonuclease toxin of MazEF toxin-antitoxin module
MVPLPVSDSGLDQDTSVKCHQIRVLARERLPKKLGEVSPDKMSEIEAVIAYRLGLLAYWFSESSQS